MVVRVVAVLAVLEQRAELDRLVGLVVVHRAHIEPGQAQREGGRQRNRDDRADARPRHFAGVP